MEVAATQGTRGRALVLIESAADRYSAWPTALLNFFGEGYRVVHLRAPSISFRNGVDQSEALECRLAELGVRSAFFVGFGRASIPVQGLCLRRQKVVRSLALVDPLTRPAESPLERLTHSLEQRLPLGLPLRQRAIGFDSEPFLHRLRVPILVVTSVEAGQAELGRIVKRAPLSWQYEKPLSAAEFPEVLEGFLGVAPKFPMRRRG